MKKKNLHLPVALISVHRQADRPFRTVKDALWARYGKGFGKLLDGINRRAK